MPLDLLASLLAVAVFIGALSYAAMRDVLTMTVSDRLVLALLAAYAVLAPLAGWPLQEMAWSVAALMITFFVSVAFFAAGWIGGGDGKLATATVLWVGAENALNFVAYTAVFGGLCTIALLLYRSRAMAPALEGQAWAARLHAPTTGVPYAVAIGLAGLSVLPSTPWVAALGG